MMAAFTPSRRKMFSKVRVTDVVPAPDEPVMAMMGWRSDMVRPRDLKMGLINRETGCAVATGALELDLDRLGVVTLDALDLILRTEDQADALVQ